jgi:hypothetical protein
MADNIQVTQGYGTTMATDYIGGVHYPRSKLVFGEDGSKEDVSRDSPLPVAVDDIDELAKEDTLQSVLLQATTIDGKLASIGSKIGALATETTLSSINGKIGSFATETTLASIDGKIGRFATETTLASIDGKISGFATEATLSGINVKVPAMAAGRVPVDPFGTPGTARQLSAGATSQNTALTSSVRRVSVRAVGADIRYAVGGSSRTASATSHFIAAGERLVFSVPESANIAVIRAGGTDGTLELTEL